MVKCLKNQGHENTASTKKVIIYVKKFFDCLNMENKNDGAWKWNDLLSHYVSAEDARLKVCKLLLDNFNIFCMVSIHLWFVMKGFNLGRNWWIQNCYILRGTLYVYEYSNDKLKKCFTISQCQNFSFCLCNLKKQYWVLEIMASYWFFNLLLGCPQLILGNSQDRGKCQ